MEVLGLSMVLYLINPMMALVYLLLENGGYINPTDRVGVFIVLITFGFVKSLMDNRKGGI